MSVIPQGQQYPNSWRGFPGCKLGAATTVPHQKQVWHCCCNGPIACIFTRRPKAPSRIGGLFGAWEKAGQEGGMAGYFLKVSSHNDLIARVSAADSSTRVIATEGRGPRLRKENPRNRYAVWETKTRALRMRLLPTDPLSCGNQPAHIRMIIVAAAALDLLPFHSGEQNRMH